MFARWELFVQPFAHAAQLWFVTTWIKKTDVRCAVRIASPSSIPISVGRTWLNFPAAHFLSTVESPSHFYVSTQSIMKQLSRRQNINVFVVQALFWQLLFVLHNVKLSLYPSTTHCRRGGKPPLNLKFNTECRRVMGFTSSPLYLARPDWSSRRLDVMMTG
jgi:hypothetical protein